jgi:dihydropteroate synthase
LNVTPDSFSDGGRFLDIDAALAHARLMIAEGAGMIDIGGQSTRPGYEEISEEEEFSRTVPIIAALAREAGVPLSIDSYKPNIARAALEAGAHLLNDIHGLQRDPAMAALAAEYKCPIVVMHNDSAFAESPGDTMEKIASFFERSLEIAASAGIEKANLILDPGIGFAKTREQSLEILARLAELQAFGCPLLVGASRKSVIGLTLDLPASERLEGTLATTALAVWHGVDMIRVHDVQPNLRTALMAAAIRNARAPLSK